MTDVGHVITGRLDQAARGAVVDAVTARCVRCAEPVMLSPLYAGRPAICTVCVDAARPVFPAKLLEFADQEGFRAEGSRWFRGVLYEAEPDEQAPPPNDGGVVA